MDLFLNIEDIDERVPNAEQVPLNMEPRVPNLPGNTIQHSASFPEVTVYQPESAAPVYHFACLTRSI
jgi:hypothetical protein